MIAKNLNYILILGGGLLSLYEQSLSEPNQYLLILGLLSLMVGIYRTSKFIPSKSEKLEEPKESDKDEL